MDRQLIPYIRCSGWKRSKRDIEVFLNGADMVVEEDRSDREDIIKLGRIWASVVERICKMVLELATVGSRGEASLWSKIQRDEIHWSWQPVVLMRVYKCLKNARQLLNGGCRQDYCGSTRVNLRIEMIKKTLVRVVTDVASVRQDSHRHDSRVHTLVRSCFGKAGTP